MGVSVLQGTLVITKYDHLTFENGLPLSEVIVGKLGTRFRALCSLYLVGFIFSLLSTADDKI